MISFLWVRYNFGLFPRLGKGVARKGEVYKVRKGWNNFWQAVLNNPDGNLIMTRGLVGGHWHNHLGDVFSGNVMEVKKVVSLGLEQVGGSQWRPCVLADSLEACAALAPVETKNGLNSSARVAVSLKYCTSRLILRDRAARTVFQMDEELFLFSIICSL